MDKFDRLLLKLLQEDAQLSVAELGESVGLSPSAAHRRVKALEQAGIITGYRAMIDGKALGLGLDVFVEITLTSQSQRALDTFEEAVRDFDDILECHLMSGQSDYLLRVAASSVADYDRIHRTCLARLPGVSAMHSRFTIRAIKNWNGYPVSVAGGRE